MMTENEMRFYRTFSFTDIFVCVFDVVKINMQRAKSIGGGGPKSTWNFNKGVNMKF
jgi:hypothetical protein